MSTLQRTMVSTSGYFILLYPNLQVKRNILIKFIFLYILFYLTVLPINNI